MLILGRKPDESDTNPDPESYIEVFEQQKDSDPVLLGTIRIVKVRGQTVSVGLDFPTKYLFVRGDVKSRTPKSR